MYLSQSHVISILIHDASIYLVVIGYLQVQDICSDKEIHTLWAVKPIVRDVWVHQSDLFHILDVVLRSSLWDVWEPQSYVIHILFCQTEQNDQYFLQGYRLLILDLDIL